MAIDAAAELAIWTRRVASMYAKDLRALTDEAYHRAVGEKARSMQDVTAEVAGFNMMVAKLLRGEDAPMPTDEQRAAFTASLARRADAEQILLSSADALATAIESVGHERLETMTQAPWGEPMSFYFMANLTANHMLYHDGQLNIVQCLHGDDAMHWFDEDPATA
jgi:uncharacterized damage-inducible protein DinB